MDHPIYKLDKAIVDYLRQVLTAELGEKFEKWDEALAAAGVTYVSGLFR